MKKNQWTGFLLIAALAGILAIGANASADPETGYGRGPGYGYRTGPGAPDAPCANYGSGRGYGLRSRPGFHRPGYLPRLNEETIQKLEEQRKAFFDATGDLRREVYSKHLALRSELARKNPDAEKAAEIQKEISTLQTEIAQKRIQHQLEMKKIDPDFRRGFAGRGAGCYRNFGGGPAWR